MKKMNKYIILFCVVLVYILALILVPVIGKKSHKDNFRKIIYSENKVDGDFFEGVNYNCFTMYVDYDSKDIEYYNKYKKLDVELYLSIYSISDLDNYNSELFDGIFIKNLTNKDDILNNLENKKCNIRLLTNNKDDYEKYKDKVETFILTSDIVNDVSAEYNDDYFFVYCETTPDGIREQIINYFRETKNSKGKYGLVLYVVK